MHPAHSKRFSSKAAESETPRRTFPCTSQALSDSRTPLETVFNVLEIKNPQGLDKTLRIAPASHPRLFPRPRGNDGQFSRQVFWLMVHPTPRAFPSIESDSGVNGFRPHSQRRDREGFAPSSLTRKL